MRTKSILTAAAIALVAGLGSASADENFSTIAGLSAQPLSAHELAEVRGAGDFIIVIKNELRYVPASMSDAVSNRICGANNCIVNKARPAPPLSSSAKCNTARSV